MPRLYTGLVASLLLAGNANAALLITAVTITPNGPNYDWAYTVAIQPNSNMRVNSGEAPPRQNDFFTLYDFPGLVGTSVTPLVARTFSASTQNVGITPLLINIPELAAVSNVTVRLTGGGDIIPNVASAPVDVFTLTLTTNLPGGAANFDLSYFSGQSQLKFNGLTEDNAGRVIVPLIPEPACFGLLAGLGALVIRRRR